MNHHVKNTNNNYTNTYTYFSFISSSINVGNNMVSGALMCNLKEKAIAPFDNSFFELCDTIIARCHLSLLSEIEYLRIEFKEIINIPKDNTDVLSKINDLFEESSSILVKHIAEEAEIILPCIKDTLKINDFRYFQPRNTSWISYDNVIRLISALISEGYYFDQISELKNNYSSSAMVNKKQKRLLHRLKTLEGQLYDYTDIMINKFYPVILDLLNQYNKNEI